MNKKFTVAIIGTGNIAGYYDMNKNPEEVGIYTHAGSFLKHGGYVLEAASDSDTSRLMEFSEYWGIRKSFSDYRFVIEGNYDIISVCTPDETHYKIIIECLINKSCKLVFIEKPAAQSTKALEELIDLSNRFNIKVLVNFQRKFEKIHNNLKQSILNNEYGDTLSVSCCYIKGLSHVGVTMIDTIVYLFGTPQAVSTFNRVYNSQVQDYTYEFILYYPGFTVKVFTIDHEGDIYNYHIFELDMFFSSRRISIIDNSQCVRVSNPTPYAYSGVKVLSDSNADITKTEYSISMLNTVDYIYKYLSNDNMYFNINTLQESFNNKIIEEKIVESWNRNHEKIIFSELIWKK